MRLLVGDRSGDEVMTEHREEIASIGQTLMQESMDTVNAGVIIERVALRQLDPPREAQAAFNRVNEARARKQQMIEQAERAMVEAIEAGKGKKDEMVATARGTKLEAIEQARGEATKFELFLDAYAEAPEVTRKWLYYQTMTSVMAKAGRKVFVPGGQGSDLVKLLPLGNLNEAAPAARAETAGSAGGAR
jgi:membrane protease subunit HflK